MMDTVWRIDGHEIRLTHLERVVFPGRGGRPPVTKGDYLAHLRAEGHRMVPFLVGRAVTLLRAPDGVGGDTFWQRAVPEYAPDWIERWEYTSPSGELHRVPVINGVADLVWFAQHGAVEFHPWTSSTATPDAPDWALIDIDPGDSTTLAQLYEIVQLFDQALRQLDVISAPKMSGQTGIQIWIPVAPVYTFDQTRDWIEALSRLVGKAVPELVSWRWRVDERHGLARLDYTQNARNKTLVAPFSTRAKPGAPVSVPIEWRELDELERHRVEPDHWTIRDLAERRDHGHESALERIRGMEQKLPAIVRTD